ncbi:GspE/PulE family protein [Entomomonas asaccharolytica]|uniref:Type II/IV secretion system protein n=1 Tax=Entomomonas asaccharolytica TaxID=2785331 RepID=A0A974NEN0_9GAMM|nr:GspE/PulE family protein [Entomomonas asaccharolytica]QQP85225.1 type II/IV secretion system protein [Entomomonas asaccharolytica]
MAINTPTPDRVLTLNDLLTELLNQERITKRAKDLCYMTQADTPLAVQSPLEVIANQKIDDLSRPGKKLDIETLSIWLADYVKQPYRRIDPLKVDVNSVTSVMSYAFAKRNQILAVEATPEKVVIASVQPLVKAWEENLLHVLKRPIERVVINPADIQRLTNEFYNLSSSVTEASGENLGGNIANSSFEQLVSLTSNADDLNADDSHIIKIVDWLFQYAFQQRASDIHVEPRREFSVVRLRIDGVLHNVYQFPPLVGTAVVNRLKTLGRMNIAERRKPQDGRVKTVSPLGDEIELRLSTLPTAFGEKMVMRIFDPNVLLRGFAELGFSNEDLKRWNNMTAQPNGIILVTGPTGSGKTTTLYTTLKQLATPEVNVCTIEDPIEMIEDSFNQMQVQHNIELDFASGIRALMRQDPDIIMVGEIRDLETAEMAIQAALTGHLVLSTVHTNDAPSTITRLLDLGVPYYLIKSTILGIMAQRLVRTLCPHCKEPVTIDQSVWDELTKPWKSPVPNQTMRPVGCPECRETGFRGRLGLYEVMLFTDDIKKLIQPETNIDDVRIQAYKDGMHSLRLSGAQKVGRGLTTIDEILRVTPH